MKVAWKIALYNLVFHQLIQHCSIFYKKNAFQSTKNFRRFQWQNMLRMSSECMSYNLEFQNFLEEERSTPTCVCGARFVPLALNSPPTL